MTATPDQLNQRFAIPNVATFTRGQGGLTFLDINTAGATGQIYLHGAHVTRYERRDEPPILWMSGQSWYEPGKPIRGGVPVIFPWFGQHASRTDLPNHGFVRLREWSVESLTQDAAGVSVTLATGSDEQTRAAWPHDFALRFRVTVGPALIIALQTRNTGREPFTYEDALHTYFTVGDIRRVTVRGLEHTKYTSKVENVTNRDQAGSPIAFTGETDRIYHDTEATCVIEDPSMSRQITVAKRGSRATVVWNPWTAKAKAMPDFGDDEWPGMLCVETINARQNAVRLGPSEMHETVAEIR
jgi:glucose-6-phosphate 1-epimerase